MALSTIGARKGAGKARPAPSLADSYPEGLRTCKATGNERRAPVVGQCGVWIKAEGVGRSRGLAGW